jgi:hypothetical protein
MTANGDVLDETGVASQPAASRPWWRDELPYLAMLMLALGGVAYTGVAAQGSVVVWMLLAVAFAGISIAAGWRRARGGRGRWRLIWTQGLHWGALLLFMQLLFVPDVQRMLNTDATGFTLLALLALGTFLAGVHAASWRICAAALLMAVAVPLIAFFEQWALLLLPLEVLVVAAILGMIWWQRRRRMEKRTAHPEATLGPPG